MTDNVTLSPRQRKAIAAMLTEKDTRAAAKAAKVSERQLYRWLSLPAFVAELKSAESAAIEQAVRRLSALSALAVDTLGAAMSDGESSYGVKIRAADIVLSRLVTLKELHDLETRIAALEAKGNGNESHITA